MVKKTIKKIATKQKNIPKKAIRYNIDNNSFYIYDGKEFKKLTNKTIIEKLKHIPQIVLKYKKLKNVDLIRDSKYPKFVKGLLTEDGNAIGERIKHLPNGKELHDYFSIFAKGLTINENSGKTHWDLVFQLPCGELSYIYTKEKYDITREKKAEIVDKFDKNYNTIKSEVNRLLGHQNLAMPTLTLLSTLARVGNHEYFITHKHKGLSTLQKKDITIKGNSVNFKFIGKDGVPQNITESFPKKYIDLLKQNLSKLKKDDFVFTNEHHGTPLHGEEFTRFFKSITGEHFYPHIVRSHYADKTCKEFIENNKHRKGKVEKKEVDELYTSIALKLGHKKFVKKDNEWEPSFQVTINSYIRPSYVKEIEELHGKIKK